MVSVSRFCQIENNVVAEPDILTNRLFLTSSHYAPTSSFASAGWYSVMNPATALAATVSGEARYICPGPERPGKLRFCALITIWSGRVETPGPALMQAPQLGSITIAPAFWKTSRYPLLMA